MFDVLPGHWTPVAPLAALEGNPVPLEVAGERVVAFRDATGGWHTLLDRCPHRSGALSRGEVMPDGTLRCRYHGWRFGGEGACRRVPLNELGDRALARIRATALPTRTLAGALWVFTGTAAAHEPVLPESLQGDPAAFGTYFQDWNAHWTRAMENFLDFAHPAYVHRETIGAWSYDAVEAGVAGYAEVTPTDWGFMTRISMGRPGGGARLDWVRPNLARLHFIPNNPGGLHVFCIPLNERQTRVMTVRRLPAGTDGIAWSRRAASVDSPVLGEDRDIVEAQAGEVPEDGAEVSVATDAPSIAFRRWYHRDVRGAARARGGA